MADDTISVIKGFVMDRFPLARKRGIQDDDPLLENGILDSLGVLDVVQFVEERFGVNISDEDLTPDNFQSLVRLSEFVQKKLPLVNRS